MYKVGLNSKLYGIAKKENDDDKNKNICNENKTTLMTTLIKMTMTTETMMRMKTT